LGQAVPEIQPVETLVKIQQHSDTHQMVAVVVEDPTVEPH
jgi:hypothetical protein